MSTPIPKNEKTLADPYYRYKRNAVEIKEQKSRYVWDNFEIIMQQLHVDQEHFKKKFRRALNQPVAFKNGALRFKSMPIVVEDFLEAYIARYVICGVCGLPELSSDQTCRACGI